MGKIREKIRQVPLWLRIAATLVPVIAFIFSFFGNISAHLVNEKVAKVQREQMQGDIERNTSDIEQNRFHLQTVDTALQQVAKQTAVIEERTKHTADDVKIIKEHLLRSP